MKLEYGARWLVIGLVLGLPLAAILARWLGPPASPGRVIEIHARMPESGGWAPADLRATVGEALVLRLTSDDVVHGFAIGQSDWPAVDVLPGQVSQAQITFDRPGTYTYYCTRWCGPNHWRMRGTIEVSHPDQPGASPGQTQTGEASPPLYVTLGLDIDAPRLSPVVPQRRPSATLGANLGLVLPSEILSVDYYRSHSPLEIWQALRQDPLSQGLSEVEVWDLVALGWRSQTSLQRLELGEKLYAENCAACHGETGAGDGVFAAGLDSSQSQEMGRDLQAPADFSDASRLLAASPALLQGKILRGGMGTGMPYWGPIFTEDQVWALVEYLWTFQFDVE